MREQPDVALVDVRMPGGGASAARGITSCAPGTRVLAFTAHDDRETVLQMLEAGAIGYLLKGDSIDEIVEAIHRAADGQAPLSAEVAGEVIDELLGQLNVDRQNETQTRRREKRIRRALEGKGRFDDGVPTDLQPLGPNGRRRSARALSGPAQARPGSLVRGGGGGRPASRARDGDREGGSLGATEPSAGDLSLGERLAEDPPLGELPQAGARELRPDPRRRRGDRARQDRRLRATELGLRPPA